MSSILNSPTHSQVSDQESKYRSPQMRIEALRGVLKNAQALQSHVNKNTVENLENLFSEVEMINQEVSLEGEVGVENEILLDSDIMAIASNVFKKCILSLSTVISNYDPIEFSEKIKDYKNRLSDTMRDGEPLPCDLLKHEIIPLFRRKAQFLMLLGTLKEAPKKVTVTRKSVREVQAPIKRPENVLNVEKTEDSVEETIKKINIIIKNYQKTYKMPLDFFSLVLHPTDFGKTIENILHISFLIRDGFVTFTTDEDGIPQVSVTSKEDLAAANGKKKTKNIQNIISLTMPQWRGLVKAYNIQRPMIDLNQTRNSTLCTKGAKQGIPARVRVCTRARTLNLRSSRKPPLLRPRNK